jgi:hypothetical protein
MGSKKSTYDESLSPDINMKLACPVPWTSVPGRGANEAIPNTAVGYRFVVISLHRGVQNHRGCTRTHRRIDRQPTTMVLSSQTESLAFLLAIIAAALSTILLLGITIYCLFTAFRNNQIQEAATKDSDGELLPTTTTTTSGTTAGTNATMSTQRHRHGGGGSAKDRQRALTNDRGTQRAREGTSATRQHRRGYVPETTDDASSSSSSVGEASESVLEHASDTWSYAVVRFLFVVCCCCCSCCTNNVDDDESSYDRQGRERRAL